MSELAADEDIRSAAIRRLEQLDLADDVRDLAIEALPEPMSPTAAARPIGELYLQRLRVQGFRGIGPRVELELDAKPGVTLVVGRNGSGKSSLAEALELLLTDENHRWKGRTKVWREGWRNLHRPEGASIEAAFAIAGTTDEVVIRRRWRDDAVDVGDAEVVALDVDGAETTLDALGWTSALRQMRPFLPYTELGAMFDEPRAIYDALAPILGLDEIEAALESARERRLAADKAERRLAVARRELLIRAEAVDEPRARALAELLRGRTRRVDDRELALLLGEGFSDDPRAAARRRLAMRELPSDEVVAAALDAYAQARQRQLELSRTSAARERALAELVERALALRAQRLDERCPVCGTEGVLDEAWATAAERKASDLRRRAEELDAADGAARDAARTVEQVVDRFTGVRELAEQAGLDVSVLERAAAAWQSAWDGGRGQVDALPGALDAVVEAVRALRDTARTDLHEADERWRPLAAEATSWRAEQQARIDGPEVRQLRAAEQALGRVLDALRAERIAPIADGTKAVWEALRQQSNVALRDFGLVRRGANRAAKIDVAVDDRDSQALAVLSQGELNALALSVFLPRATLPDSPFRFAIIDDPVQAMDPAKVDGLARVLHEHGRQRQIVVLTHDTRLPEAMARLGLEAHIVDVQRDAQSVVRVRRGRDLLVRYLDDARTCADDDGLEQPVRARVCLALCRSAIELAATRAVWRRRLRAGVGHDAIEQELERCPRTGDRVAAALKDHADEQINLYRELRDRFGAHAVDAVTRANGGSHGRIPPDLNLRAAIKDASRLAQQLDEQSRR